MCGEPLDDEHRHVVNIEPARPAVHLPRPAPALHQPAAAQGRYRSVPDRYLRPDVRASPTRSGTSCRSRSAWRSSSRIRRSGRPPRSTRARPAPPRACCPSTPGPSSPPATRSPRRLEPDVEALLVRRPTTGGLRVPSRPDRRLLRAGRAGAPALEGLRRRHRGVAAIDEFFDRLQARSRPGRRGRLTCRHCPSAAPGRAPDRYAAAPTLLFGCRSARTSGVRVHAMALRCQIRIEPQRRHYDPDEAGRLLDLFGDRARWGDTLKPLQFADGAARASGVHRHHRDRSCRCPAPTTSRSPRRNTSTPCGTARSRCCCSSAAPSSTAGRRDARRPDPVGPGDQRPLPVPAWRDMMDLNFPGSAGSGCAPTRSTRCSASSPGTRSRPGTRPSRRCCERPRRWPDDRGCRTGDRPRDRARAGAAGRRRGPLRGLRALPLPCLGDRRTGCAGSSASSPRAPSVPTSPSRGTCETECLIEPRSDRCTVSVQVRFLQIQARTVERAEGAGSGRFRSAEALELADRRIVPWEEGVPGQAGASVPIHQLLTRRTGRRLPRRRRARPRGGARRRGGRRPAGPATARPDRPAATVGAAHPGPVRRDPAACRDRERHAVAVRTGRRVDSGPRDGDAPRDGGHPRHPHRVRRRIPVAARPAGMGPPRPPRPAPTATPGRCWSAKAGTTSCWPRRSSWTTTRRSLRRAPASSTTPPRSTRSSACAPSPSPTRRSARPVAPTPAPRR